jgi:dTDP-glucose pyrophosphorylase
MSEIARKVSIEIGASIKQALKQLDETSHRILFVVDKDNYLRGTMSDGDARRAILAGTALEFSIEKVFNRAPHFLTEKEYTKEECKELFIQTKVLLLPVVDSLRKLIGAIAWEDIFNGTGALERPLGKIDVPVVIMAGGKGTRMAPFTNILPKPLIPVGEKTILEKIIEGFVACGADRFYATVNYRGEMIKAYFDSIEKDYILEFVWEKEFLGTAGCLRYLERSIDRTFIVSNCDIIVRVDYADVIAFHAHNSAALTVISSIQHISVPYGVIHFKEGGAVDSISEKPEYSYPINTGVYILEPRCLSFIPEGRPFHMTDLIAALIEAGERVFTYPVNEKEYLDIGQWEEYRRNLDRLA